MSIDHHALVSHLLTEQLGLLPTGDYARKLTPGEALVIERLANALVLLTPAPPRKAGRRRP